MIEILLTLVTYRLSLLLVAERGPLEIFDRLRWWAGVRHDVQSRPVPTGELAHLFLCMRCMSLWVGVLVGLLWYQSAIGLLWGLAFSAGAILLHERGR